VKARAKLTGSRLQPNHLRIIGGQWRGRKLRITDAEGLRPTGDRIRETLFNWLAPEIHGSRCLDIFAGSGALGLEALSRGAAFSYMLELDREAATQLGVNLAVLGGKGKIYQGDTLNHLRQGNSTEPFEIVFIDPPFTLDLWRDCIDALETGGWLAESASIYIEAGLDTPYQVPVNWALHRDKCAGNVNYRLYYREPPEN